MVKLTATEAYAKGWKALEAAGIENARFDAACILEKHTGIQRAGLAVQGGQEFAPEGFLTDIKRRISHEPLQYILGKWPFFGLDFFVGEGVLVPRQDTELLCEAALAFLDGMKEASILELCAGSGCVTAAILKNHPGAHAVCVEISEKAAGYLRKNLALHGLNERVRLVIGDMLAPGTPGLCGGNFDAVVCNPPYIRSSDIPGLQPEVAGHEPWLALDGGNDGLRFYRGAVNYFRLLKPGGLAVFEIGADQAGDVSEIVHSGGLHDILVKKDYGGNRRVVSGIRGTQV